VLVPAAAHPPTVVASNAVDVVGVGWVRVDMNHDFVVGANGPSGDASVRVRGPCPRLKGSLFGRCERRSTDGFTARMSHVAFSPLRTTSRPYVPIGAPL
jgi:hypothetical protein